MILTPLQEATTAPSSQPPILNAAFLNGLKPSDVFGVVIAPSMSDPHRVDIFFPGLLEAEQLQAGRRANTVEVFARMYPFGPHRRLPTLAERFGTGLYSAGSFREVGITRFSLRGCVFSFFGGGVGLLRFDGPLREAFATEVHVLLKGATGCQVQVQLTEPLGTTVFTPKA